MSHHAPHNAMKGHPHPGAVSGRRWWHLFSLRTRSDATDHVVRVGATFYPGVFSYVSGHRDAPLTPRARMLWWTVDLAIIAGGILLIIFWIR